MKSSSWKWIVVYGIFLIVMGIIGFASNPEKAKTALLSGGFFGGINIVWGVLLAKGFRWAQFAAFATTLLLMAAFSWRAWAGWTDVANGEPKLVAASLISAMLIASITMIPILVRDIARTSSRKSDATAVP